MMSVYSLYLRLLLVTHQVWEAEQVLQCGSQAHTRTCARIIQHTVHNFATMVKQRNKSTHTHEHTHTHLQVIISTQTTRIRTHTIQMNKERNHKLVHAHTNTCSVPTPTNSTYSIPLKSMINIRQLLRQCICESHL